VVKLNLARSPNGRAMSIAEDRLGDLVRTGIANACAVTAPVCNNSETDSGSAPPLASVLAVSTGTPLPTLSITTITPDAARERGRLVRRARRLSQLSLVWHFLEAAIAIAAGAIAGSVALVGFGADSLIEAMAGITVIWLMSGQRPDSPRAERRAQHLIAGSFALLAIYIAVEAAHDLIGAHHPSVSWPGITLATVTLIAMPPLASAKRRVGVALGSAATTSESRQTLLCAYLSAGLLAGLLANALAGWWSADPIVALAIAAVALREAHSAWQGDTCDCC
jgi:cation efflux family protein